MLISCILLLAAPFVGVGLASILISVADGRTVADLFAFGLLISPLLGVPSFVIAYRAMRRGATGRAVLLALLGLATSALTTFLTLITFARGTH